MMRPPPDPAGAWHRAGLVSLAVLVLAGCGQPPDAETSDGVPDAQDRADALPAGAAAEAGSAFVRQFADSPVRWQPWGEAAFALAAELGRPVFAFVGHPACPWSQQMRRDSLDSPGISEQLNRQFVPVLVDAEEFPEIGDAFARYMAAARRQSGWPICAWLTPGGLPLSAVGYIPAGESVDGTTLPAMLDHVSNQWERYPEYYLAQAERDFGAMLRALSDRPAPADWAPPPELAVRAYTELAASFDPLHGGLSAYPKFPLAPKLEFLLWAGSTPGILSPSQGERALSIVRTTLDKMAASSLYDHVGGGFFRYSTDASWDAPSLEKLLSDQAQMIQLYARASRVFDEPRYAEVARGTLDYLEARLARPGGGYASSEDTGNDGGGAPTGSYYVFSSGEIGEVLDGQDRDLFLRASEIQPRGNIPSAARYPNPPLLQNLPRRTRLDEAAEALGMDKEEARISFGRSLEALRQLRETRPPPRTDTTVLLSPNALTVSALAAAAESLDDGALLEQAEKLADFLVGTFWDPARTDSPLVRAAWENAAAGTPASFADYALLTRAILDLQAARPAEDGRWLALAAQLQSAQLARFWDGENSRLQPVATAGIARLGQPGPDDLPAPSGVSVIVDNLLRLDALEAGGLAAPAEVARALAAAYATRLETGPGAATTLVRALAEPSLAGR